MGFEPLDANYKDRVRESFARQGFMSHLHAALDVPAPGTLSSVCTTSSPR